MKGPSGPAPSHGNEAAIQSASALTSGFPGAPAVSAFQALLRAPRPVCWCGEGRDGAVKAKESGAGRERVRGQGWRQPPGSPGSFRRGAGPLPSSRSSWVRMQQSCLGSPFVGTACGKETIVSWVAPPAAYAAGRQDVPGVTCESGTVQVRAHCWVAQQLTHLKTVHSGNP